MTVKKISIILIIIIFIVMLIYLVFREGSNKQNITANETSIVSDAEKKANEEEIKVLKTMTEKERIKKYLSNYMMLIEGKQYEKAYNLLYPEFKQNYFQDMEKYQSYAEERYPTTMVLSYSNIERQGHYFIIYVNIIDPLEEKEYISQKFIIYENDYNDYIVSFEVL